jgi:protein-tyrosine-phosphatase
MKTITFLCYGNVCRSPVSEAVLRGMLKEAGITDITVNSMGTSDIGKQPRDGMMTRMAERDGYTMSGYSTFMSKEELMKSDLILVMTTEHLIAVQKLLPYDRWERIQLFNKYCFGLDEPVNDPSDMQESVYRNCYMHIVKGCRVIVQKEKDGKVDTFG